MKHLLRAFCAIALLLSTGVAHAQGTVPLALTQTLDINGKPQAGALLYTFVVGTVAQPQTSFQDTALSIPNPWPLVADQNGRIPMFYLANGSVHVRLTDSSGNVQYDNSNILVVGPSGGSGGGGTVDPTTVLATGDLKVKYGTGAISGFVRSNGLTIGSTTSGATERANADTQNLFVYLYNADPNLVVSGGRTGNALTDFNANKTITLPDWRGRSITALADMGNTPTTVLTATWAGASVTTLGAAIGAQNHTLALSEIPSHSHPNSLTDPGHSHSTGGATQTGLNAASFQAANGLTNPGSTGGSTTGITITNGFTGGGAAHSIVMPAMLATIYIKL